MAEHKQPNAGADSNAIECPLCESKIEEGSKSSADLRILIRLRLSLSVKCAMSSNGCGWEGDMSQFWEHLSSCLFFPRPCPFNCDPNVYMPRDILRSHLQDKCPLKSIPCEYKWAGCDVNLTRKEMAGHMKDCVQVHNELLAKAAKSYKTQVSALQAEIDQLKANRNNEGTGAQDVLSPVAKKRKVTFSQNTDIINGSHVTTSARQLDNSGTVITQTTPTTTPPATNSPVIHTTPTRIDSDAFLSPIVGYANDMRKKEKQCPPSICRYVKSDWRTLMIMCQSCETWYHSMCAHIVNNKVRDMTEFTCSSCKK